jgi:hypothetical protein
VRLHWLHMLNSLWLQRLLQRLLLLRLMVVLLLLMLLLLLLRLLDEGVGCRKLCAVLHGHLHGCRAIV